ncbi:MAG: hypothetical protein OXH70_17295 [Acidobacteria bacterium]|nr:hypothetical protein [Acidobacteriota bacterium]
MTDSEVLHHADGRTSVPEDLYNHIFNEGKCGDWFWSSENRDGKVHRTIWILVPAVGNPATGKPLADRGLELAIVFPIHGPNNWAEPGDINGWDGNEEAPTLEPSIWVRGETDNPGWHGFFRHGRLVSA